jgi:hypothetical protein
MRAAWRSSYNTDTKEKFYRKYNKPGLYKDPGNSSPLRNVMAKANRHTLGRIEHLKTGNDALGFYFKKVGVLKRNHNCKCGQPETVDHLLNNCAFCESGRRYLKETFP